MLHSYRLLPIVALVFAPAATFADAPDSFELGVVSVVDSVLEHHIDPPTKQEMILHGVKWVYQHAKKPVPMGLSQRISELSTKQQIVDYLTSLRSEFEDLSEFERIFMAGMFRAVPGGGALIRAEEARVQGQLAANRYVGVGIALGMTEDKRPEIQKVFYDGPGWKAGVKSEDLILEIDGESTSGKDLRRIVKELRGAEGTTVKLMLKQPDQESREIEVIRGVTFIPTIEGSRKISEGQWQYTVDSAPDVALLRIRQFGPSTLHELKKIQAKLRDKNIQGLVLDLRSGGGLLHDVVMFADQFMDEGTIGSVKTLDAVTTHEAHAGSLFRDVPVAILIASYSNADRVYLAAALQDHKRAIVIGEPTRGETYVKSQVEMPSGDKLVLATGLLRRGDGTTLLRPNQDRWVPLPNQFVRSKPTDQPPKPSFIMPDYVVRFPGRNEEQPEVKHGRDPMLSKAIEVLRKSDGKIGSAEQDANVSG